MLVTKCGKSQARLIWREGAPDMSFRREGDINYKCIAGTNAPEIIIRRE